jgi:acylaminoacyl-peptidase
MTAAMMVKLGFKVLFVNYRGSTGFDEKFVNCLPGFVGDLDVKDVISCIDHLTTNGQIDAKRVVLFGGSHGGFLATHVIGQYPERGFAACVCRNPVTDMAGMTESTDIPDWCWTEALGLKQAFDFQGIRDPELIKTMLEKSPMFHVHKVVTPTLMLLGKKDRRVPMSQGLKFHMSLKARGIATKCHIYDDKHDLQQVQVDGDVFVNSMLWILFHMNRK